MTQPTDITGEDKLAPAIDRALLLLGLALVAFLLSGWLADQVDWMVQLAVTGAVAAIAYYCTRYLLRCRHEAPWPALALAACYGALLGCASMLLSLVLPGRMVPLAFACLCALLAALLVCRFEVFRPEGRLSHCLFCTLHGQFAFYYVLFFIHRYVHAEWLRQSLYEVDWLTGVLVLLLGTLLSGTLHDSMARIRLAKRPVWSLGAWLLLAPLRLARGVREIHALTDLARGH